MATKTQLEKNEAKMERNRQREKLTNWYMINLTWGIVGIMVLWYFRRLHYTNAMLYMQQIKWILTGVFAVASGVLFTLSATKKVKNTSRVKNYGIFMAVCAFVSLWLALYNQIRVVAQDVLRTVLNNPSLAISSYWNIRIPIIAICVYLVVAFVVYVIKVSKK